MQSIIDWWNRLPYTVTGPIVRAVRVFVYAFVPALALFTVDGNAAAFELAFRTAISAALLALIDKGVREQRIARNATDEGTDPVIGDEA